MTLEELGTIREDWFRRNRPYRIVYWEEYNYADLNQIIVRKKAGKNNTSFNDCIIMADTETSKKKQGQDNHVVAWTLSIRAFGINIVTLYGRKPSGLISCIELIRRNMNGAETFIYWHNMPYDWTFIRKFCFRTWGLPEKQLNVKSHYPIFIQWDNGIMFRDSLILAQRSLDKWAKDLDVEHQKACGLWDYDKLRSQYEDFSDDELTYIEHDTLAGVECIDKMRITLNKSIYSMPYTATGIPREAVRKLASENNGRSLFLRIAPTATQQAKLERVYHGGYTHGNRHYVNEIIKGDIQCRDFASSYPNVLLGEKYPMEAFSHLDDKEVDWILANASEYAFMFKLILVRPRLKDDWVPMPALQFSKAYTVNSVLDNGRILAAEYVEIEITELDLAVINEQYTWDWAMCVDVEFSKKDYLPKWLTDYIFELFRDKTTLKGGDPVLYALAKALLNSIYGMMVQKPVKETIVEHYLEEDGEHLYTTEHADFNELYEIYINKRSSILPYFWGVWVTAYAFRNLFELGKCVDYEHGGIWAYSDTDSCYATKWNEERLNAYNERAKQKLRDNGYGCVEHNGREYWLGVAEPDSRYTEYIYQGAKRYCGRSAEDGELHITVAGVPKKGAVSLKDDINNFRPGFIFPGEDTGKLTHSYNIVPEIYIDEDGNETGDSIDLSPCAYRLDSIETHTWEELLEVTEYIQTYEE